MPRANHTQSKLRLHLRRAFLFWLFSLAAGASMIAVSKRHALFTTLKPTPQLFAGSDEDALVAYHITTLVDRDPPWYLTPNERDHYRQLLFFSYAFNRFLNKSEINRELHYSADLHTRSLADSGFSKLEPADEKILTQIPYTQTITGYHSPAFESQQLKHRAADAATKLLDATPPRPYP